MEDELLTGCFYFHKKSEFFCDGEHIWETLGTSRDFSSDTLDVFVSAAFEVANVRTDKLWVLVFLRLVSGSVIFCGPFLKWSSVVNSTG